MQLHILVPSWFCFLTDSFDCLEILYPDRVVEYNELAAKLPLWKDLSVIVGRDVSSCGKKVLLSF